MIDLPPIDPAAILAREAGPPHVAMAEPTIEASWPGFCANLVAWTMDTRQCQPLPEYVAKLPTDFWPEPATPFDIITGGYHAPFYAATPSGSGPRQSAASHVWGGIAGGAASASAASSSSSEATATARADSDCGCPDRSGPTDPGLTPVPLPAAGLLLGAGLLILNTFRRRFQP